MNYAAALELPTWTAEIQSYSQTATRYTPIVLKAFSKTIAPQLLTTFKDLSRYYVQCGRGAGEWAMTAAGITHNPLQSAVRSAHAELTSAEAQATYSRIRHITREAAMDALVVGLCGVVAVATTIETAQTIYRHAKRVYRKVDAWLNPSTPSAEMAKAADDLAAALAIAADVAEAQAEAKALPLSVAEPVPDFWLEPMPFTHTPPVFGKVWNPAPGRNMHEEVERLRELQHVPLTLAAAAEPVKQPTRKGRGQTKAAAAPAIAEDELVMALDVPGAIGGKRQLRAKVGASKAAAAKPKEARARAKTGARAGVK